MIIDKKQLLMRRREIYDNVANRITEPQNKDKPHNSDVIDRKAVFETNEPKKNNKYKPTQHYYFEGDNKAHQPNYTYLKELQEQLERHTAKKYYAVFQNKGRYMDEAQAYFNEIQRLEGKHLRHHPSSEAGKFYSEIIKKKKGIINQLRRDFDFAKKQSN